MFSYYNPSGRIKHSAITWYKTEGGLTSPDETKGGTTRYDYHRNTGYLKKKIGPEKSISYEYDSAGNIIEMSTKNGVVSYEYDQLNRLHTVAKSGDPATKYLYDLMDEDKNQQYDYVIYPNGMKEKRYYNPYGNVSDISHIIEPLGTGEKTLAYYSYVYDNNGNIISETPNDDETKEKTYVFDAFNRLTQSAVGVNSIVDYTYDAL